MLSSLLASLTAQVGSQPAPSSRASSASGVFDLQQILTALVVIALELLVVALVCGLLYGGVMILVRTIAARMKRQEWQRIVTVKARNLLLVLCLALAAVVIIYNGWLLARGVDVRARTTTLIRSVTPDMWIAAGMALAKLALAVAGIIVVTRLLRRLAGALEKRINRWDHLRDNNKSLAALFRGLDRAIVSLGWMLAVLLACVLFAVRDSIISPLVLIVRIYLVLAIGVMVIRSTAVIVDTLDGLSHLYAQKRGWLAYYDHLRPLLPTFRACLEYALWIALGSVVLAQLASMRALAAWGPLLIQGIAIFFGGRVIIELGRLEIGRRMLPSEGLEETERRRRATMVPLVRSAYTYGVYFGTAVLILSSLGFNPMPFLAGAGILGLVIGFGAQSLINDVVSGFFILFENIYLVGDMIEVGGAKGVVEAIEFRTTKIRDAEGRIHIMRNGDMKPVINYSKDYTMAVVSMEVAYGVDLSTVFAALRQAGERLRRESPDVLAEMQIDGITAFGPSTMTVRTSTRVRPGRHEAVAADIRFMLKDTFDRLAEGTSRTTLVAEREPAHRA
jgi:moderate conductance mechanosensitive channel